MGGPWTELGIDDKLTEGMKEMGITKPNDLQVVSIPDTLKGTDVILSSYTGSGKTLAGILPFLHIMLKERQAEEAKGLPKPWEGMADTCKPRLLVLTPTRELSLQFLRVLEDVLMKCPELRTVTEEDVLDYLSKDQLDLLYARHRPDVVVATPKEVLVLLQKRALSLENMKYLMLDEVDMLVDTDRYRLDRLLAELPTRPIQKVLASASALGHPEMKNLISKLLPSGHMSFGSAPADAAPTGRAESDATTMSLPPTLTHAVLEIRNAKGDWATTVKNPDAAYDIKLAKLLEILKTRPLGESTLVFVHKKTSSTRTLLYDLRQSNIEAELLTGTRRIRRRNVVAYKLMEEEGRVVVATDELAARGLDYESVTMVVNFDLPFGVKNYLHRAGRAGRAGRLGTVISMVSNAKEKRYLSEKLLGRLGGQKMFEAKLENSEDGNGDAKVKF
eukprot:CAMPEP_0167812698 /NCGR_PEP_ID=MMETSP0112_2-20121227/1403_1 /TAXON_ID=91324 /ORGANISM="Lotharella globosa, Strain CCCM811" /LENGTH=445 /DNA_ID=CAMNT_0007711619 /DNA_START=242 /DNA_END=1576 /DNA_ORIENTATION=-